LCQVVLWLFITTSEKDTAYVFRVDVRRIRKWWVRWRIGAGRAGTLASQSHGMERIWMELIQTSRSKEHEKCYSKGHQGEKLWQEKVHVLFIQTALFSFFTVWIRLPWLLFSCC
jgi:hypothetical protein